MMEKKNKRDTSKKRHAILEAAGQAFQELGYENTSMDKIAEVAKASKRTVYNHFPSKDELFHAVIDKFAEETASLKEIIYNPDKNLKEQLSEFAEADIILTKNPKWLGLKKIFISVFIRDNDLARQMMTKYGTGQDQLVNWLVEAAQDGKMDVKDPQTAATIFKSMISGAFIWPVLFTGPMPEKAAEYLKDEILETFLARYGKIQGI